MKTLIYLQILQYNHERVSIREKAIAVLCCRNVVQVISKIKKISASSPLKEYSFDLHFFIN